MNTTDTAMMVENALASGYGLWVETDMGDIDLAGEDLRSAWEDLSPGESFVILGVVV